MTSYWLRLRAWLTRVLLAFEPEPAAGQIAPDRQFAIDDGVTYEMPLVVPDWVTPQQRAALVQAAVREAASVYHFQFDRPYLYSENLSQYPTADPLREWDWSTRREVLARCHLAHERNPLAHTAVSLTTRFTVGEGLTVNYYNDRVEEILEDFRAAPDNAVQQYEKSFLDDLQVDGELFIRFADLDGRTVIAPIPPWEVDWIKTEPGFHKRTLAFHQSGQQSDGTPGNLSYVDRELPADEVLHVAINQHSYETRGRPELFRILPWLKAYKDWLEGRARQNHWRGSLLYHVQLQNATGAQVSAKRAQYRQPPPPGSLVITNDKEAWNVLESKVGAADVAEDGRQMKLMVAVGAELPEYMLSDGANANLASSKSQQLPALRKFVDFQDIVVGQVWRPIYDRVLQNAIEAGLLPDRVVEMDSDGDIVYEDDGLTPRMIDTLEAYDVAAPELESDDPNTLAQALQIAVNAEWVSNETASGRMGFDYNAEKKKIEREAEAVATSAYQGRGFGQPPEMPLPAQPFGANGNTVDPLPNGNGTVTAEALRLDTYTEAEEGMITVRMPRIEVPAPVVHVAPAQITVNVPEQPPPSVTVNVPAQPAPVVTVQAPKPTAPVVNIPPEGDETLTVERDRDGRIVSIHKSRS